MKPISAAGAALALALAGLGGPSISSAQTVWRCGAAAASYTQTPCPGGREIDVADERTAEQVRSAIDVAGRERRLADRMTAERHAREALPHARTNRPARTKGVSCPAERRSRRHANRPAAADTWRAIAPATRRTKG
jgi:hypothetical protein